MPSLVNQYPLLNDEALTLLVSRHFSVDPRKFPLLSLFEPRRVFNSGEMTWDIVKGHRSMASITLENASSPMGPKEIVGKGSASPAVIKEKDFLDSETLSFLRLAGQQHIADARANADARIAAKMRALNSRRLYRKHWMAAQALQGSLIYQANGLNININYGLTTLTPPTTKWTDTSANIPKDLDALIDEFTDTCDLPPNRVFVNRKTMSYLRGNQKIQSFWDAPGRREELIGGIVTGLNGLDWIIVDGTYVNDAGTVSKWIPDGIVIFVSPGEETDEPTMQFGSTRTVENEFTGGFRARTWETEDPKTIWLSIYENVLPVFYHPERVQIVDVD